MQKDNSASRLYLLLLNAKEVNPQISTFNAWRQVLQVNDNNKKLLLSRMGKMLELPMDISDSLDNLGSADTETTSYISSKLHDAFFGQKFDAPWKNFISEIDVHILTYLKMASSLLESHSQTKMIDDNELESLRKSIVDLIEEFKSSKDIEQRLKSYIVDQLHKLIMLIDDYFITGAQPIMYQVEATVGHAFVDEDYRNFLRNDRLGKKLIESLQIVANLTTVAVGLPIVANSFTLISAIVN